MFHGVDFLGEKGQDGCAEFCAPINIPEKVKHFPHAVVYDVGVHDSMLEGAVFQQGDQVSHNLQLRVGIAITHCRHRCPDLAFHILVDGGLLAHNNSKREASRTF